MMQKEHKNIKYKVKKTLLQCQYDLLYFYNLMETLSDFFTLEYIDTKNTLEQYIHKDTSIIEYIDRDMCNQEIKGLANEFTFVNDLNTKIQKIYEKIIKVKNLQSFLTTKAQTSMIYFDPSEIAVIKQCLFYMLAKKYLA